MVVEIKDTQSEIIKLITNLHQNTHTTQEMQDADEIKSRERRERSKERI